MEEGGGGGGLILIGTSKLQTTRDEGLRIPSAQPT